MGSGVVGRSWHALAGAHARVGTHVGVAWDTSRSGGVGGRDARGRAPAGV